MQVKCEGNTCIDAKAHTCTERDCRERWHLQEYSIAC
jgi:hypothetical protein